MLTAIDHENLKRSIIKVELLAQSLQLLATSENPLLADIALELVARSVPIGQRLLRLKSLVCSSEAAA